MYEDVVLVIDLYMVIIFLFALIFFLLTQEHIKYEKMLKNKRTVKKSTKDKFPNGDGTYHTTYRCPHCGCMIHLDWHEKRNFCPECGCELIWEEVKKQV